MNQNGPLITKLAEQALADFIGVVIDPKLHKDPMDAIGPAMAASMSNALSQYLESYLGACSAPPCGCVEHRIWRGEAWRCLSCKHASKDVHLTIESVSGKSVQGSKRVTACEQCEKPRPN